MDGTAGAIIVQIESLGFTIAVRRYGGVQRSATPAGDPDVVHVPSNPAGDGEDEEQHSACDLAQAVGIDLEDG